MEVIFDDTTHAVHPWRDRAFCAIEVESRMQEFALNVLCLIKESLTKDIRKRVKALGAHFEHWVKEARFPDSEDLRLVLTAEIEPNIVVKGPEWSDTRGANIGSGFIIFPEFILGGKLIDPKIVAKDFTDRIIIALTQHKGALELEVKRLSKILEEQKRRGTKSVLEN